MTFEVYWLNLQPTSAIILIIKSIVIGRLENFRGKQVLFVGQWQDEGYFKYDIKIEAIISNV